MNWILKKYENSAATKLSQLNSVGNYGIEGNMKTIQNETPTKNNTPTTNKFKWNEDQQQNANEKCDLSLGSTTKMDIQLRLRSNNDYQCRFQS